MPWTAALLASILSFTLTGAQVRFEDVTAGAGIEWTHRNGATPEKFLIETMGGGGAFLDYDGDGWLDIFLVDSGAHHRSGKGAPGRNALYRNRGDGSFEDVTSKAGLEGGIYANGVAVGDYDNDGDADIYLTAWGDNILYRNDGRGRFENVTSSAGVAAGGWSTSAAFVDVDNDGRLDLFVCQYLDWDYDKEVFCGERREGYRSYCHPNQFQAVSSILYRNNGDGTFTDVTKKAGLATPGKALGVVTGDIDQDGDQDIYVANDAVANFLFINRGDGTFSEEALMFEVAYGAAVKPESGMGADMGDFDGDGTLDLIVTNIDYEMNNLYLGKDRDFFTDVTISRGAGQDGLHYSGFGVRFFDYDNDGDLDLAVVNGHPLDNIHLYRDQITSDEPPLLFENRKGKLTSVGASAGEIFKRRLHGRALASGDYDNDGAVDMLFVNNGSAPVLLRNQGGSGNRWIGLQLQGGASNRDGVGAVATITTDRRRIVRYRTGGGSYQAAHDPRLHFGLGVKESIRSIEIRWPSGKLQKLKPLGMNAYHFVKEP